MNREPLIFSFQTDSGNYYIFDVGTNLTYPVNKLDIEIIKNYRKMSLNELKEFLKDYPKDQIEKSYRKITVLVEKGKMFFPDWSQNNITKISSKMRYFQDLANLNLLTLEVTQDCNLRCRYCPFSSNFNYIRIHKNKKMTWEVAKRSIDYYIKILNSAWRTSRRNAWIGFYGGEPLIEFDLIKKCVEYSKLRQCNVKILHNLTTNGTLFNEKIIKFLINNEIDILISLDGPQSEHDKHRVNQMGVGSFSKVNENLELILNIE